MIYVISKATFGEYNVRDIQCNANWDCCPYSDYALIPEDLVDDILETKGYCNITLNSAGTVVESFAVYPYPSEIPEECCGINTVLSVNGVTANKEGAVTLTPADVDPALASGFTSKTVVSSVEELNTLINTLAMEQEYDTVKTYSVRLNWYANAPLPTGRWSITIHKPYVDTMIERPWAGVTATVIASQRIHKLQREMYDGLWLEWEWENPNMDLGVEYRTTERWQNKPIYTTLVDIGTLPNKSSKQIQAVTGVGTGTVIDAIMVETRTADGFTFAHDTEGVSYYAANYGGNISIMLNTAVSDTDMSAYSAQVLLRYTKS